MHSSGAAEERDSLVRDGKRAWYQNRPLHRDSKSRPNSQSKGPPKWIEQDVVRRPRRAPQPLENRVIPEQRMILRILRFEFGPALSDTDHHRPIEPLVWPNRRAEVRRATEI